jgi:hypothetical protein
MTETERKWSERVAAKLVLDVPWQRRPVRVARVREERLEVIAHHGVENRLGGTARAVGRRKNGQGPAEPLSAERAGHAVCDSVDFASSWGVPDDPDPGAGHKEHPGV